MTIYEDSVAAHLTKILNSDEQTVIVSSAKILCETVKDFVAKVEKAYDRSLENAVVADAVASKCSVLNEKLEQLLQVLHTEPQPDPVLSAVSPVVIEEDTVESSSEESLGECKDQLSDDITKPSSQGAIKPREIMLRANSLKKAVRQVIEEAGKVMDEQMVHSCEPVNQLSDCNNTEISESTDDDTKELLTGLRAGLAASIAGSSIINKMLLANIDPFGATPFIDPDLDSVDGYSEKCVMNNYFGIGLDAKISLEFNNKREEHPEKYRSRTKNLMWYGVLGTRELLQRSYKNLEQRVQLEAFESTLKSWEDKQKCDTGKTVLRTHLFIQHAVDLATEEVSQMQLCSQAAEELITRICDAATIHCLLEQELAHAVNACSHALNKANPRCPENLTRDTATEIAINVKALYNETESLLVGRVPLQLESPHEERVASALHSVEVELQKLTEIPWLYYILHPNEEEEPPMDCTKRNNRSTVFRIVPKFKKEKVQKQKTSTQPGPGDTESGPCEANSAGN
ncbi:Hypothetical predicted protein [Marmota monax]|uniref:Diacylglycerol kinase accessory domain-containing protein n=1 Tax=Marmota monax TaxID=9995 RepID=A0A5E4BYF8_MARMO|nr:Hypothetical predicted protein [Marmota monax]